MLDIIDVNIIPKYGLGVLIGTFNGSACEANKGGIRQGIPHVFGETVHKVILAPVGFIGYDDIEAAAHCKPPLTTVKMDKEALGHVAARALIEGDVAPNEASLPVELVVRESSLMAALAPSAAARKPRRQVAPASS